LGDSMNTPLKPHRGASALSYALLIGLVGVIALSMVDGTGQEVESLFCRVSVAMGDEDAQDCVFAGSPDGEGGSGDEDSGTGDGGGTPPDGDDPLIDGVTQIYLSDAGVGDCLTPETACPFTDGVSVYATQRNSNGVTGTIAMILVDDTRTNGHSFQFEDVIFRSQSRSDPHLLRIDDRTELLGTSRLQALQVSVPQYSRSSSSPVRYLAFGGDFTVDDDVTVTSSGDALYGLCEGGCTLEMSGDLIAGSNGAGVYIPIESHSSDTPGTTRLDFSADTTITGAYGVILNTVRIQSATSFLHDDVTVIFDGTEITVTQAAFEFREGSHINESTRVFGDVEAIYRDATVSARYLFDYNHENDLNQSTGDGILTVDGGTYTTETVFFGQSLYAGRYPRDFRATLGGGAEFSTDRVFEVRGNTLTAADRQNAANGISDEINVFITLGDITVTSTDAAAALFRPFRETVCLAIGADSAFVDGVGGTQLMDASGGVRMIIPSAADRTATDAVTADLVGAFDAAGLLSPSATGFSNGSGTYVGIGADCGS